MIKDLAWPFISLLPFWPHRPDHPAIALEREKSRQMRAMLDRVATLDKNMSNPHYSDR